jgi:hypothetical protein
MKHDPRHVAYLRRYAALEPLLDEIRATEVRQADTVAAIHLFDTAFKIALRDLPPRQSSGIVEWQRVMMRARG